MPHSVVLNPTASLSRHLNRVDHITHVDGLINVPTSGSHLGSRAKYSFHSKVAYVRMSEEHAPCAGLFPLRSRPLTLGCIGMGGENHDMYKNTPIDERSHL
jgi:hypothetical protein